jgi:hypothetical protein
VAPPYGFGWGEAALGAAAPPGPPPPPAEALVAGLPDDPDGPVLAMPDGLVLARAEGLRPAVAAWLA